MAEPELAKRLSRHAEALASSGRSPLYVELMRGAALDARGGGVVGEVFAEDRLEPGSVPALRLMAALHHLVLAGRARDLARFFASAGGREPPGGAWAVADVAIRANFEEVRRLAARTVQTNEPGRAAPLYGALLWLTELSGLPISLLEIGASGGLNLLLRRYSYVVGAQRLGAPSSSVSFEDPWIGLPVADPVRVASRLEIFSAAGCDVEPIDAGTEEGALRLLSYVWPDEPERVDRVRAATAIARREPLSVDRASAAGWLADRLDAMPEGSLTVVWHSVVRQYVSAEEWNRVEAVLEGAGRRSSQERPLAWLGMEPGGDRIKDFVLSCRTWPGGEWTELARCGDHGPPVAWNVDVGTIRHRFHGSAR